MKNNKIYIVSMITAALGLAVPVYSIGYAVYYDGIGGENIKSVALLLGIVGFPSWLLLFMAWLTRKAFASSIAILGGAILSSGFCNYFYVNLITHPDPQGGLIFLFVLPPQLIGVVIYCTLVFIGWRAEKSPSAAIPKG